MAELITVGTTFERSDGGRKVTGRATYLADLEVEGMLYAAVLRSTVPNGQVTRLDVTAARTAPGVHAVVTPDDIAHLPKARAFSSSPAIGTILTGHPRFVGDALVAVAAESAAAARRALDLVDFEIEELDPVLTIDQARAADVVIHAEAPDNRAGPPVHVARGDVDLALERCEHVFEAVYSTPRQLAQTIEPLSCVCSWEGQRLDVWTHLDNFFHLREQLAEVLAIDELDVRIHAPDALGATFGLKNGLQPSLEAVAALLSRESGRPVKLALSPEESHSVTVSRHPARIHLTTGVDSDGTIVARRAHVELDAGAYGFGYIVAFAMVGKWATLYPAENIKFTGDSFYTNHMSGGAYRAVGTAQIHFAMECQMDEIANALDIDPIDLRRRNAVKVGDSLPFGTQIRSLGLEECLERGSTAIGWPGSRRRQSDRGRFRRGVGMALGLHSSGLTGLLPTPEESRCSVTLHPDGRVVLHVAAVEKGQGALGVYAAVLAEILRCPIERIEIVNTNTDEVPFDLMGAEASRGTYVQGRSVADAATRLLEATSPIGSVATSIDEVLDHIEQPVRVDGHFAPSDRDPLPVIGAHFCDVEVDVVTGRVRVIEHVAVQDVGKIISELGCRGQIEGAVHHGIGLALLEEFQYSEGQPLNPNFMGYKVLMAGDMPRVRAIMVEAPDPDGGPFGAKGVGTPAVPAVAPAVVNAVYDAVGIRVHDLPVTPRRLLPLLREHGITPT